jgi:hypothetical protein
LDHPSQRLGAWHMLKNHFKIFWSKLMKIQKKIFGYSLYIEVFKKKAIKA